LKWPAGRAIAVVSDNRDLRIADNSAAVRIFIGCARARAVETRAHLSHVKGRLSPQKLAGRQLDDDDDVVPASHTAIERSRLPASVYTVSHNSSGCFALPRRRSCAGAVSPRALCHLQEEGGKGLDEVRDFFAREDFSLLASGDLKQKAFY